MALTVESVVAELACLTGLDALDDLEPGAVVDPPGLAMPDVCRAVAHGSLMGRGATPA